MVLTDIYTDSILAEQLEQQLQPTQARVHIDGMTGSMPPAMMAALARRNPTLSLLAIAPGKEEAYYLANDLETLLEGGEQRRVMLFPTSYRRAYHYDSDQTDNSNVLMRSEVLKEMSSGVPLVVVSYPEALSEKVVGNSTLLQHTLRVSRGQHIDMWDLVDRLQELGFEREDFVVEPGQYAVRGGIVDVYSYASDLPYRLEFFDDNIDSVRTYDAATQLSVKQLDRVDIVPQLSVGTTSESSGQSAMVSLLEYFSSTDIVWCQSLMQIAQNIDRLYTDTEQAYRERQADTTHPIVGTLPLPQTISSTANEFLRLLLEKKLVEYGNSHYFSQEERLQAHSEPQPVLGKQFDLLVSNLREHAEHGYRLLVTVSNDSQKHRLQNILGESGAVETSEEDERKNSGTATMHYTLLTCQLSHGFIDHDLKLLCYTDHEIFERYHKYTVRNLRSGHEAMTLKELFELKPGDFVTHIDYGVGRFSGLEKVTRDGKSQELIRLIYKNNDVLYISIHGLHKISRYVGREGEAPTLNRLGSNTWQVLKQKTKRQVNRSTGAGVKGAVR